MKRPSNIVLGIAILWAAALGSSNYRLFEIAGWVTVVGVCVAANFKEVR